MALSEATTAPQLPATQGAAPGAVETVRAALGEIAGSLGFAGAVYMHLGHGLFRPADPQAKLAPRRLVATAGFNEEQYLKRNYLASDPLAHLATTSLAPFAWALHDLDEADPGRRRVCEAMARWGMRAGIVTPIPDYALGPALLNLYGGQGAGSGDPVDHGRLMLAATRLHAAATSAGGRFMAGEAELHPREIDVLRLAAIGRTESETAQALGLSRRGVQFHLARAVEKLDAPNKTAAVARAVSTGLIKV
jgi:DNA-binding CsgD family transcriptional regulator